MATIEWLTDMWRRTPRDEQVMLLRRKVRRAMTEHNPAGCIREVMASADEAGIPYAELAPVSCEYGE